jgi:hypothetical protein
MHEVQRPSQPGPAVAGIFGIAGQGFLMLAKQQGWHVPEGLIYFIGIVSIIALVISAFIYIRWAWRSLKSHFSNTSRGSVLAANARRNLIPIMLAIMAFAGVLLIGAAVAGYFVLHKNENSAGATHMIVVQTTTPPSQAPKNVEPTKLAATEPPEIEKDELKIIGRYLQLQALIAEAQQTKNVIDQIGIGLRDSLKPGMQQGSPLTQLRIFASWQGSKSRLQSINDGAYINRAISFAVDQTYMGIAAPGEDVFGDDADARLKYRAFHYEVIAVKKQADLLLGQMNDESKKLEDANKSNANWKLLGKG